ncbi:30S ribosomal protein S18 [Desulfobotulus mexicanus]|uniref:Small ribosomal subunit protein bS18 n=1 Tax=Desulfobotulus mexicanus TaxID=2586642 RepID=A0A5S5ME06_9BACT|nr:30S ribosomal protein S18 [Desulfobotulus mexicanus]TYT73941.1 30S ribosomal protein S18 [Desulfobotulus mexicanus]
MVNPRAAKVSRKKKRRVYHRRKVCRFCADTKIKIEYKDPKGLKYFVTERGKIIPRRITGTCSKHQRLLTTAIKRSRNIALMPFVGNVD